MLVRTSRCLNRLRLIHTGPYFRRSSRSDLKPTNMQQWTVTEPYLKVACKLGEGPYYSEANNQLRFVDINSNALYLVDLEKGPSSVQKFDTGMPIGVTADIEGQDPTEIILAGAKDGVTKFNLKTCQHEYVAKYWKGPDAEEKTRRMRSNDGAVDTNGRFWVEAFVDPEIEDPTEEGVVFRLDHDGTLNTMYENIVIPNGITWNRANNTMYLSDTTVGKVWAFDYDPASGDISNKQQFFELEGENPDGHAMDAEGNIWHAIYGGSKVIRINVEGKITGTVSLPTRNITCPTFAGTSLFITSAEEEDPEKHPESAKYAGNLFKVDVGVTGMPKYKARLR